MYVSKFQYGPPWLVLFKSCNSPTSLTNDGCRRLGPMPFIPYVRRGSSVAVCSIAAWTSADVTLTDAAAATALIKNRRRLCMLGSFGSCRSFLHPHVLLRRDSRSRLSSDRDRGRRRSEAVPERRSWQRGRG